MVHKTQGCAACKKRKIKCDESRPGCLRCQKVGRQCPGYPDKWDVNFVSENAVVYAKVHSHQEPTGQTPTRRPLPQLVTDDLQAHAINLFFRDYVLDESTEKLCPGWLSFLPVLYQQEGEDSIIHHAVRAAAYANLAQKTDRPDISVKATSHYLKSIAIVNNAISDHQQATSDVTITAVVLLGLYECINSTLSKDISLHHIQGLGALADLRKSLLMEGNASNLVPLICCQMQRRNLDLQLAPGAADDRLVGLLDPTSLDHRMIFNMYEVSKFANQARRSFEVGISNNSLFMTFERLDQHYLSWSMDAKVIWGYNTIQHSIRRLFLPRPKEMEDHIYVGIWTAGVWNKQRSTRIILHQTFLETISKMINDPATAFYNERRAASMSIISDMVEDILASVPFVLGDLQETTATTKSRSVGGYFLVWSLSVILRCPYSTEGQRDEAKHVLERVGKQCGIRYATVYAQSFGGNRQQLETQPLYAFE